MGLQLLLVPDTVPVPIVIVVCPKRLMGTQVTRKRKNRVNILIN
jgi:hypothetical protein